MYPKWGIFGPKIDNFFLNLLISFFLKSYLMTSSNEWVKLNVLDFEGKLILCSKLGNKSFLEPQ